MAKVIKEIIIVLLLCLGIIVLLGILLYEYVPMTKTIPTPVSYSTPENVKEELSTSASIDDSKIIRTYQIDSTDLSNYRTTQDYKPGKANPFSSYEQVPGTSSPNASGNGEQGEKPAGDGTATNTTTNTTTTSGGQFFQDKGTK